MLLLRERERERENVVQRLSKDKTMNGDNVCMQNQQCNACFRAVNINRCMTNIKFYFFLTVNYGHWLHLYLHVRVPSCAVESHQWQGQKIHRTSKHTVVNHPSSHSSHCREIIFGVNLSVEDNRAASPCLLIDLNFCKLRHSA